MPLNRQRLLTEPVDETRYLAAGVNTTRYRLIMRHFYEQHRLHHYALSPSQVLTYMRNHDDSYTESDCQQDLQALDKWGNLEPDWELGLAGVRTIEDFRRRNIMYAITPDAIAIEELMVTLEQRGRQIGELDNSAMGRLWELLSALENALALPQVDPVRPERIRQAWDDLWMRFDQTATASNDYMGDMRRQERDRLLDLAAFQVYKETLIRYLTGFVEGLASNREQFRNKTTGWDTAYLADTLATAALATTRAFEDREHLCKQYIDQVQAFVEWFSRGGSADQLGLYASHAIERVTGTARRLSEARRGAVSRAQDLLQLADHFYALRSEPEKAERVAAVAFGLTDPRHWQLELPEQASDQYDKSPWASTPWETLIRPKRTQGSRRQDSRNHAAEIELQRVRLRAQDRQRQLEAAALVDRLFRAGDLVLGEARVATGPERDVLLAWTYECLSNAPGYTTRTADGSTLQIVNPQELRYVWLGPDSARMLVPNYRLRRQKERVTCQRSRCLSQMDRHLLRLREPVTF